MSEWEQWSNTCSEWLLANIASADDQAKGTEVFGAIAGGIMDASKGEFWGACGWPDLGTIVDDNWGEGYLQHGTEYSKTLEVDDGTGKGTTVEKQFTINELLLAIHYAEHGSDMKKKKPEGFWMGGKSYKILQSKEMELSSFTTKVVVAQAEGKVGVVLIKTKHSVAIGAYSEEKGVTQGNCVKVTSAFAEYLINEGY